MHFVDIAIWIKIKYKKNKRTLGLVDFLGFDAAVRLELYCRDTVLLLPFLKYEFTDACFCGLDWDLLLLDVRLLTLRLFLLMAYDPDC